MNVFDASALLAFVQGEPGADVVERELLVGGVCSAANWSETAQIVARRRDWSLARSLLLSYPLSIEPVLLVDAERAAQLWASGSGLSLGDRLCLATGERMEALVWTADTSWGAGGRMRQIR